MRIGLLNTYPLHLCGGVERMFTRFANAFVDRRVEVHALGYLGANRQATFALDSRIHWVDLSTHQPWWARSAGLINVWAALQNYRGRKVERLRLGAKAIAQALKPMQATLSSLDMIVCFQVQAALALHYLGQRSLRTGLMLHFHPQDDWQLQALASELTQLRFVQVLLPVFEAYTRTLFPKTEIITIGNPVPISPVVSSSTRPVISTLSRVVPSKRIDLLLEAFAQLHMRYPEWQLHIYGPVDKDAQYVRDLMARVQHLGLTDKVQWMGVTKRVYEDLAESSIFAFPSASEGFGLALVEAMSCGLPVVGCQDAQAVAQLIEDGQTGFLTAPQISAYANALEVLMRDRALRLKMGANARRRAADFEPDRVWQAWLDTLARLA